MPAAQVENPSLRRDLRRHFEVRGERPPEPQEKRGHPFRAVAAPDVFSLRAPAVEAASLAERDLEEPERRLHAFAQDAHGAFFRIQVKLHGELGLSVTEIRGRQEELEVEEKT